MTIDVSKMTDSQVQNLLTSGFETEEQLARLVSRRALWAVRGVIDSYDLDRWRCLQVTIPEGLCTLPPLPQPSEILSQLRGHVESSPVRTREDLAQWHVVLAWADGLCMPLSWASLAVQGDVADLTRNEPRDPSRAEQREAYYQLTMEVAWVRSRPGPDRYDRAVRLRQLTPGPRPWDTQDPPETGISDHIRAHLEAHSDEVCVWWGDIGLVNTLEDKVVVETTTEPAVARLGNISYLLPRRG